MLVARLSISGFVGAERRRTHPNAPEPARTASTHGGSNETYKGYEAEEQSPSFLHTSYVYSSKISLLGSFRLRVVIMLGNNLPPFNISHPRKVSNVTNIETVIAIACFYSHKAYEGRCPTCMNPKCKTVKALPLSNVKASLTLRLIGCIYKGRLENVPRYDCSRRVLDAF